MEDIWKNHKLLNFWIRKISSKVEIPFRRRGDKIGDKAIFKHRKVEETWKLWIRGEEQIQRPNQKWIELPLPKDNLEKGMKEGNT